jgi:predicted ATP-grasp superfamily ATP-dependent carboligase
MIHGVIIIGAGSTALAVVRCLKEIGLRPIVIFSGGNDIATYSRLCDVLKSPVPVNQNEAFFRWLDSIKEKCKNYFLIPESDSARLFLAKYHQQLVKNFLVWGGPQHEIQELIEKDKLYRRAEECGIPIPKSYVGGSNDGLSVWLNNVKGPYFIKPVYAADPNSPIKSKNEIFETVEEVLEFADSVDSASYIVQQKLTGGDGNVYDCYGLCDINGEVIISATHRRIRQSIPGRGVTSFGEIPATSCPFQSDDLQRLTNKLFADKNYHGIFGVEWLWDCDSLQLYLIDVNARPFSSIGHLCDSGINLPALAVDEIQDNRIPTIALSANTKHTYWVNFSTDILSARKHVLAGNLSYLHWMRELISCSSFAYWCLRDPLPTLVKGYQLTKNLGSRVAKRLFHK